MSIETQTTPALADYTLGNENFRARQIGEEFSELDYCQRMHAFYNEVCEELIRIAGRDTQVPEMEYLESRCDHYANRCKELQG